MRKVVVALGFIVIIAAVTYIIFVSSLGPTCDLVELDARPSPDDKYISSIFQKDCGATTNFVTGVALRHADLSLSDESANTVLIADGVVPVVLRWIAHDLLEIEAPASTRIFRKEDKWNEIKVTFKSNNRD